MQIFSSRKRRQTQPTTGRPLRVLSALLPHLLAYRGRVGIAFGLLLLAKLANVSVPIALKLVIDALDGPPAELQLPVLLLIGYALLRFSNTLFSELRDALFAKVGQNTVRQIALKIFRHLHSLSPSFHLQRETGALSRDMERGTRAVGFLLSVALFNVLPTLVEIALVVGVLMFNYDVLFSLIILGTFLLYSAFTLKMTERRLVWRRAMNKMDSKANSRAIDSLLNFEAVKYFGNEEYEARRYNRSMQVWTRAAIRNQTSLSFLNSGQSAVIAVGVASAMLLAGQGVVNGTMTLGDLVLVNAYVIQICLPLNFLGFVYREIRDALADTEKMFSLLEVKSEVADAPQARELVVGRGEIRFAGVNFAYKPEKRILCDVTFEVPAGKTVAVVGGSGAGKSTLSRLLFRFYDVGGGRILIDGQDIREVSQESLRRSIGIVPQDTILFNDTIARNIAYGRLGANRQEVVQAARAAGIHDFIESLPEGYRTVVGERGLKLSGGEKQRVAIARAILKNPPILIFDEATSALDSKSEKAIQREIEALSRNRTTLIIAHRLSTVVHADRIIVLDRGRVAETGNHTELLARNGLYAQMWRLQLHARPEKVSPLPEAANL